MLNQYTLENMIDMNISNSIKQFENEKADRLTELVIEIIIESILQQCNEESNQISAI